LKYEYAVSALRSLVEDPGKLVKELLERKLLLIVQYAGSTWIMIIRSFR